MKYNRFFDQSPEYLNLLLENSNEGIFACDNQLNVTYRNKRMREIHAFPEEIPPEHWPDYIQIMEMDGVTKTPFENIPLMRALKGEVVPSCYHVLLRKGTSSTLVKYTAKPLHGLDGAQIGAILTVEDCNDLLKSQARFQAIFEQSPMSIQILDKTGKTVLVNSAFKKLWAITDDFVRDFILDKYNILEDKVLEDAGQLVLIKKAFAGEQTAIPEFLYDPAVLNLPGRARWAQGLVFPLKNSKDEVQEVVIIHQDTTDQRSAQIEKEKIFSQLEAILKQLPAGLMVTDVQGKISLYNEQMTKLIGDPDQAKKAFHTPLANALKGHIIKATEISIEQSNGSPAIFSTSAGPIYDTQGNITSTILISSDVTQAKRAELNQTFLAGVKTLLISIIDFDQILEKIANASIPFLADGCMVDLVEGDQIKRIVTKHRDPAIQVLMEELQKQFPPRMDSPQPTSKAIRSGKAELLKKVDQSVVKAHTFNELHYDLITKIGVNTHIAIPLQIRGKVIGALNLFYGKDRPLYDETDLEVAMELGRHASVAIDNSKLFKDAKSAIQLRDDFISIASHELRTPITSLHLQIEVLTNLLESMPVDLEATKLMHKFFGSTKSQLKRLTRLVDDMLDISRISTGKLTLSLRRANMNTLIYNVLDRFKDQLKAADIDYQFTYKSEVFCLCDPEKIDQVITNFMTNAIRYGQKKPVHIKLEETEKHVIINFKDHGRGIETKDKERIFKRFERAHTDEDVSGLGLGLYINSQIIEEHQGKIILESAPGVGATFIVELPRVIE
jgi:PAS domain S-box-containing protein